ncbi:CPBP family intramembrane glutamic endopeptidase [Brachybacterium fresconis]|uniref:Membrane protease YdiL (CAAX protease family) n=1 Tax=Brachybacterium fresconis TaxID=173363 RepID=A0ABS4YMU4_9MICO|nr:CPBP family intramembrane glutamic endopeptidase [Brachybacterium fresconis]MBP2410122.1 membrane protease YdiL (CAAX protease family) [Brachybacterium fresconis]
METRAYRHRIRSERTPLASVSSARLALALAVWFMVSGLCAGALLATQSLTGPDPEVLSLVMLAPAVGAGAAWLLLRCHSPWTLPRARPGAMAASLALAVAAIAIYFTALSILRESGPVMPREVAGTPLLIFLLLQSVGALTEEIGYRGLLLHGLQRWLPRWGAAVITGVLFGLWHVQYYALPPAQFAAFLVGTVALTATMAAVMTGTFWQRMAVCTVIHLGANLALAFVGTAQVPMTVFAGAIVVGAIVVGALVAVVPSAQRRSATG